MASYERLHDWTLDTNVAIEIQKRFRPQVVLEPSQRPVETIAGCDVSFNRYSETVYAGIVVLRMSTFEVLEAKGVETISKFPYVSGLLSFREIPAFLEAWEKLEIEPDAVMVDGHGIAHRRRMGIAAHFGLLVDRPTVGCAKTKLDGNYDPPGPNRGDWTPILLRGDTVGAALRTKPRSNPILVSPGNHIDLQGAIDLTLRCDGGYRLPEPTRQAHLFVNELRRAAMGEE